MGNFELTFEGRNCLSPQKDAMCSSAYLNEINLFTLVCQSWILSHKMFAGVIFFFFFGGGGGEGGVSLLYVFPITKGAPNDRMFPDTLEMSGGFLYTLKTLFG